MLPYEIYQDIFTDEWFFQVWDYDLQNYRDHGPFDTEKEAEDAALRWMQHE